MKAVQSSKQNTMAAEGLQSAAPAYCGVMWLSVGIKNPELDCSASEASAEYFDRGCRYVIDRSDTQTFTPTLLSGRPLLCVHLYKSMWAL